MKNLLLKTLLITLSALLAGNVVAQTTVTWIPTADDVSKLTNKDIHMITVGSGTQSYQIHATRPFFNDNEIKLAWDNGSVKMTDNGMDKAGIAIYVPTTSDDIEKITVYMHTSNNRKTYYAQGNPCPKTGTSTTSALAKTSTAYTFWTDFKRDIYYVCGGRKDGSGEAYYDKVEVIFKGSSTVIPVAGVRLDKDKLTVEEGKTDKLTVTVEPRGATNTNVTWSSSDTNVATVDQNGNVIGISPGTAIITVKTQDGGFEATCEVTVTQSTTPIVHVEGVAFSKSETSLTMTVGDTHQLKPTINPSNATNQTVTWSVDKPAVASVNDGLVTALSPGTAEVKVTTVDGGFEAICVVNVTGSVTPPPSTDLTLHEPEVYEDPKGYNTPLVKYNNHEYEVYYCSKGKPLKDSRAVVTTTPGGSYISDDDQIAIDGWFKSTAESYEETGGTALDEFAANGGDWKMKENKSLTMHIKGYDQFRLYAADNKEDRTDRQFHVYIDDMTKEVTMTHSTSATIRTFEITTGEHVIKIVAEGSSNMYMYGWSLRTAYVPKLKHLTGNDSTQSVLQTQQLAPVTYYLKNKVHEAEFAWDGPEATGISMQKGIDDTLYVQGTANCPNGVYKYTISAKDETNNVISSISGKFSVTSKVAFKNMIDTVRIVYEKSAMAPVEILYYSINKDDLSWQWTGTTPAGLSFAVDESTHTLKLSGTPTTVGLFPYSVTLKDANTIEGRIEVESNSPTVVPGATKTMLYLYKDNKTSGIYNNLISSYNYFARPAGGAAPGTVDYSAYDFIVISESVDANNEEVLSLIRDGNTPILNMKNFTYTTSRLGWGFPDNGSINNTDITVLQPAHPIFKGMNLKQGSTVKILSAVQGRGLMPAEINYQGTLPLATALKQGALYDEDGDEETFIHEVPTSMRKAKYILFPVSQQSAANLTADGKKLLTNIINYLLSPESSGVQLPELKITSFSIDGKNAVIDEDKQEIVLELPEGTDLTALVPQITLSSDLSHVTPASGTTIDFSDTYFGVNFTVSDYINRRVYTAFIITPTGLEDTDLEGVKFDGTTLHNPHGVELNIYDVSGRLVTTTNSDFSFVGMSHSLYLVVAKDANIKVMY